MINRFAREACKFMRSENPPVPPRSLCPYAREVLDLLAGQSDAREIVIGGGVALSHYAEYRETFDLDAWWATAPTAAAHQLCLKDFVTVAECWDLYRTKHPQQNPTEAAAKILHAIERLEMQRPLHGIPDEVDRREAATVRTWYRDVFCRHPLGGST